MDIQFESIEGNSWTYRILLIVLAALAALGSLIVWKGIGLNTIWHMLIVSLLIGVSVTLTGLVGYWIYYTRLHYVASSERHLLLGRGAAKSSPRKCP